jgi:hypothetical protein
MSHAFLEKAWELLEKEGLQGLTPDRLAAYANVSVLKVQESFPTSLSILLGLWTFIEEKSTPLKVLPDSPHDSLFEQIMSVLETLQPYQLAVRRLVDDLMIAPCWLKDMAPYGLKWARQALKQAHIPLKGVEGSLKTYAFAGFFIYILKIWASDDSTDMSLTMVKLDQGLKKLFYWILKNESII